MQAESAHTEKQTPHGAGRVLWGYFAHKAFWRRVVGRHAPSLGLCKVHKNFPQWGKLLCKVLNFPKSHFQRFAQKPAYIFVQFAQNPISLCRLHKKLLPPLCNLTKVLANCTKNLLYLCAICLLKTGCRCAIIVSTS